MNRLTFGGILRSELIKLRTLRSTVWCYAISLVLMIGIGALLAANLRTANLGSNHAAHQAIIVIAATTGLSFSQLVVAVLGALVISGEYGTGMIRTTFTAAPRRAEALLGKALVFGIVTFVINLIGVFVTAALASLILRKDDVYADWGDGSFLLALVAAAAYLALVGLIAFALGAIIRASAGAIAAAVGLVLVVPIVFAIFVSTLQSKVLSNISGFLPSNAGQTMYSYSAGTTTSSDGVIALTPTEAGLVVLAWTVVLLAVSVVTTRRRDV